MLYGSDEGLILGFDATRCADGDATCATAYASENSRGATAGDFDTDGSADVLVLNGGTSNLLLWGSLHGGGFTPETSGPAIGGSQDSRGAAWGDYNQDGFGDIFIWFARSRCVYFSDFHE